MTPIEWTILLEKPTLKKDEQALIAGKVVQAVHATLADKPVGKLYSTDELGEMLFPVKSVRGAAMYEARRRMFRYLTNTKTALDDCRRRAPNSEARKSYGREYLPWFWSKPHEAQ